MRITSLRVSNFKSVKFAELTDLPDMVVIAGPNGSGKSTLFDAVRLLKSVYGGYQPNEWQQWFSEFQIGLDRRQIELASLLQDSRAPLELAAQISLADDEKRFIRENVDDLLRPYIWSQLVPESGGWPYRPGQAIASQLRQFGPEVDRRASEEGSAILEALSEDAFPAELVIPSGISQEIRVAPSPVLQLVFSLFLPQEIGIIDYHGPQRAYQREQVGGINLNIQTTEQQGSQHALYNYANKYTNIKSEMASSFVREILAEKAGATPSGSQSLLNTLQELFSTFFPGKRFLGTVPTQDGKVRFPVATESGSEHDINDLSSGEKEVLYGYLRLYNLSPRHSVLLIDEPELHLNPRLVQGLPQFYQKHLGRPLDNQIWLLTHSDAMLREALVTEGAGVFHMLLPEAVPPHESQARRVTAQEEIEGTVIDLVGDLATYKPGAKVVVFEGGGDADFDIYMVTTLFPDFEKSVNAIHGANKSRVRQLHSLLEDARKAGVFPAKVYSIVDRDSDTDQHSDPGAISWDVYHIENYLLEPRFIQSALNDVLGRPQEQLSIDDVEAAMMECARETMPSLLSHQLRTYANVALMEALDLSFDPNAEDPAAALDIAASRAQQRLSITMKSKFPLAAIRTKETQFRSALETDLQNGAWRGTYRGRDVLKRLAGKLCPGTRYEHFRNLILAKMRDSSYKPQGMKDALDRILSA